MRSLFESVEPGEMSKDPNFQAYRRMFEEGELAPYKGEFVVFIGGN